MKGKAKLIREKKELLLYWQEQARIDARNLRGSIAKANELEKEIKELENGQSNNNKQSS